MEDDDTDFTPPSPRNTSSNLANLFGFTKKPLPGNSSLTYTAPKAPKSEPSPTKKQSVEKTSVKILFSKAVHAYKLENGSYTSQGLIGIVISGNHKSRTYEIILYKRTKEHLSQIRISSSLVLTLSPNKYVSFYDNNKQNWSIMFQFTEDVEEFSQKVAIYKFYSLSEPSDILVQDLTPATEQKADSNSTVKISYNVYSLVPEEFLKIKGEIKEELKLSNCSFTQMSKGLIGCAENCKRVILIPHLLSDPWLKDLGPNKDLLIAVKVEKIIAEIENLISESVSPVDRLPESPVDSSTEEVGVKARGASIKEALASTKSQKANLISRMARMGQATLPVKQGLSAGASDSDEENTLTTQLKPRVPKCRSTAANPALSNSLSQNQSPPQQMSVYQNDLAWHQTQLGKLGVSYQQLVPLPGSPVSSLTADPNLSVYFSESRIQAAELRMGISKISEKLDLVWNKVQNMSGTGLENKVHHRASADSGGIIISIQNIIAENENLKEKIEEQKVKIEQQSDRIFNLLELNHKYLEQTSTSHEKKSENEFKLKAEVESLQKKGFEVETANKVAMDNVKNLKEDLSHSVQLNKELEKRVRELETETETLKRNLAENSDEKGKEVEDLKEKMEKASEAVMRLKERLRDVISENESLKTVIKSHREEIQAGNQVVRDLRARNEEFEKAVEGFKKRISDDGSKNESKLESLSKTVEILEEENKCLREKIEGDDEPIEINKVLLKVFAALKEEFLESKEYSASHILTIAEKIFRNETNGTFRVDRENESVEKTEFLEPKVVPAPRSSVQNVKTKKLEKNESKKEEERLSPSKENGTEREAKEDDGQNKKVEVDSRYKSYDQSWRTAKPPPLSLFDDDEEDDDEWPN